MRSRHLAGDPFTLSRPDKQSSPLELATTDSADSALFLEGQQPETDLLSSGLISLRGELSTCGGGGGGQTYTPPHSLLSQRPYIIETMHSYTLPM